MTAAEVQVLTGWLREHRVDTSRIFWSTTQTNTNDWHCTLVDCSAEEVAGLAALVTSGYTNAEGDHWAPGGTQPAGNRGEVTLYTYRAEITRVTDGDTVVANVDAGWNVWIHQQRLRLAHINCPELSTAAGIAALECICVLLGPLPATVTVQTLKDRQEKYGRYLAVITTAAGVNVNEALVAAGHAVPYEG